MVQIFFASLTSIIKSNSGKVTHEGNEQSLSRCVMQGRGLKLKRTHNFLSLYLAGKNEACLQ